MGTLPSGIISPRLFGGPGEEGSLPLLFARHFDNVDWMEGTSKIKVPGKFSIQM